MNLLAGGSDPMAVDTVCAALMGYDVKQVPHLDLARKTGIGCGDLPKIAIVNRELFTARRKKLTHELLDDFPPELAILRGRERCCKEGCRRNTETVVEVLHRDHGGKGDFTILMGKGIDPDAVARVTGRAHIAGGCAIQEYGPALERRLGKKNVTMSPGCNNLALTIYGLCRHMKVHPLKLVPVNPLVSLALLVRAKLASSRAVIPPLV